MDDHLRAQLRAEYEHEFDVEQGLQRLRQSREQLLDDPDEQERLLELVDAADAEQEPADERWGGEAAVVSVPHPHRDQLDELTQRRHDVIEAYHRAAAAIDQSRPREWSTAKKYRSLVYMIAEGALGLILVAVLLLGLFGARGSYGAFTTFAVALAAASALLAIALERNQRGRPEMREMLLRERQALAAQDAVMRLEKAWSDLRVSCGEAQQGFSHADRQERAAAIDEAVRILTDCNPQRLRESTNEELRFRPTEASLEQGPFSAHRRPPGY